MKVLDDMGKRYKINTAKKVLQYTKEAKIKCFINIMFGFPTETEDDFKETLEFIKSVKNYIDCVNCSTSYCSLCEGSYFTIIIKS